VKDHRREALLAVRAQAVLVLRLREKIREEKQSGLRAVRLDAQTTKSGVQAGLDAGMIRREEMARILKREEALLRRLEKKARAAMEGMTPEKYAFCALYYIGAMGIGEAARAVERSERQCLRYKSEIEGAGLSFGMKKALSAKN